MDGGRCCMDDLDPSFEYKDSNSSHSWLFTYPGKLMPDKIELETSLTRQTFSEPPQKIQSKEGKRKKLLEYFYRQILAEEIKAEFNSDVTVVEPYETDYTEHFKNPDDMILPGEIVSKNEKIKKIDKSCTNPLSKRNTIEELKMKYPLYNSRPFTFFAQTRGRDQFGKKITITRPPDLNYDNIEY